MAIAEKAVDVRLAPAYQLSDVARYLQMPHKTIWNWFRAGNGSSILDPVCDDSRTFVSFIGLTEAHILSAMRSKHGIPLQRIRLAVAHLRDRFQSEHPLVEFDFSTDGLDLFLEEVDSLTNISRFGQTGMRDVLKLYLDRIERDRNGEPQRLYPFTQWNVLDDPRIVVIDPKVSFGRPMVRGLGVATAAIAERFKAGESISSLAEDFGAGAYQIEAAVRSELELQSAA